MKPIRESQIEKYLVAQVKARDWLIRKVIWKSCRNAPDRVIMAFQNIVWVELKAPGKKPTSGQLREHERMRGMGQRVEVIDSFEGVDRLLGEMR